MAIYENGLSMRFNALGGKIRRKGKDKGFILVTTMMLFVAIGGGVVGLMGSAKATVRNTTLTREFIQSGQLADLAVQDALYQLNSDPAATLPTAAAPKVGSNNGGTWKWSATSTTTTSTGPMLLISASGTYGKTTRNAATTAAALTVGAYKSGPDKQLSYEASPRTAFEHVAFGRDITLQNGATVGSGSVFLAGTVGSLSTATNLATFPGYPSQSTVAHRLYGSGASGLSLANALKAPVGLFMDPKFVTDNMSRCGGASAKPWIASQNGGRILANNNTGCYSSMDFDVPTTVEGTQAFNAFVSGGVKFRQNVSVPTGTALNIYTNGNVDFNTEESSASSLNIPNTFIYAAQGKCATVPFRSTSKPLFFSGSLSCDTINAAGKFTNAPLIKPLGDDVYTSSIWYLTDYQQPSGSRG